MSLDQRLSYRHVDVFSDKPFSGNGLTVFVVEKELATEAMQQITQEMRQFESIFLFPTTEPQTFLARVFTMEEELDFAGHPVLGAASVLHEKFSYAESAEWTFELNAKTVSVRTTKKGISFKATMQQGKPEFGPVVSSEQRQAFLRALNLSETDWDERLPLEIVSTGLPYLIVPVKDNLGRAKISASNFEKMLADVDAKFVYVFQASTMEGRTWDNDGRVEDVATGSAAGPMGAYLVRHKVAGPETEIVINQGSFLDRPSKIIVKVGGTQEEITSVEVGGDVCLMASGSFDEDAVAGLVEGLTLKASARCN